MRGVGTLLQFIGGTLGRVAVSGLVIGIFFVVTGAMPWQIFASFLQAPPEWLKGWYLSPALVIVGIAIIGASLWFNLWSNKQSCIDQLSEELAWAIDNLLNRPPANLTSADVDVWWAGVTVWEEKILKVLSNRAFFTLSDQLHFEKLGFLPAKMGGTGNASFDHKLRMLEVKFERLRDVINWTQMRRR